MTGYGTSTDGRTHQQRRMFYVNLPSGSSTGEDFDTPPESPTPVPPPRIRRRLGAQKLKIDPHVNDILFPVASNGGGDESDEQGSTHQTLLQGYMTLITRGFRNPKNRWFAYDRRSGKLKYYDHESNCHGNKEVLGEIDVHSATFKYDVQMDRHGEFTICTKNGEYILSAGSPERRIYWLQHLQRARREYSTYAVNRNSMFYSQVGLLKEKTPDTEFSEKENSPFREIMQTLERPLDNYSSPPRSADYIKKTSFFQSLTRNRPNFRMPRSASMRTPSPPLERNNHHVVISSPPPKLNSPNSSFQALSKIRKSFRDKKGSPSSTSASGLWGPKKVGQTAEEISRELFGVKEDLQASLDDASASKEVISILQKQIQTLQKENETMASLQKVELDEGHLLEILRTKDGQIVDLEISNKEQRKCIERQDTELQRERDEISTYQHLLEAKDDSIVRLTNQIHEIELHQAVVSENSPKLGSSGISFDSDKFEFKEFVDIGVQTDLFGKEREHLLDTVTAYEMQNKFLNKEVLELNQLKQQAIEREQKLFIEASDWEAKFYQIQSKYLLLLNELHNPQVSVSASRQEMVGQLLKDIVEAAEKPVLTTTSASYDRFGFRIDSNRDDSLEDKAEKLRRQAEDINMDSSFDNENPEKRWEEIISILNSRSLSLTNEDKIKHLCRKGIPICQRGAVWKAVVDYKLIRRQNESFQTDYYKKLLSNYNPSRNLTPAAKQIELDLLRTLPNNKHYDSPHADGIPKLRRVLLAYSVHNPDIEYCQGFNRIASIALLFMNEEDAFWCLVYIIEHAMPEDYYSRDKQLIGAQVEQEVLKELLTEKIPRLAEHFNATGMDSSLFTLNWFLCIFVDNMPVNTYLHIWDSFLFEENKVLLRYALAIFKYLEEDLLQQTDYMSIVNTLRKGVAVLVDVKKITQIAFHDLNPFPYKSIKNKRTHHAKLLEANRKELDTIRLNYRKNSLVRSPMQTNSLDFPDGEEENNTNRSRIDDEGSTCQKLDSEQQKEVIDLTDSPIAVLITCDENEDTAS
ncbi:TBC1 domain family member 2B isoform X3 [Lepeophtheirus salmonis]|uniref:TBC1 domain family member 2B isoform X3 n=1 Tax=Lepeophtheirus salmonis TaxID=72036 RepID=UPI003AF3F024